MNDPGTEQPIADAAAELEPQLDGQDDSDREEELEHENEQDLNDPSRWWFASTGVPLIACTIGPLANAFSLLALVEYWRVYIPPGQAEQDGIFMKDPGWLLAVNAISFICAIAANMALLLNMSRRLRFKVAQPISVIGFFLAGILLIVDMAIITSLPRYGIPVDSPAAPGGSHALS